MSRDKKRRPQSNMNLPPRSGKSNVVLNQRPQNRQCTKEKTEAESERFEASIFVETLKLPVKPACFFSIALPSIKAEKPQPD